MSCRRNASLTPLKADLQVSFVPMSIRLEPATRHYDENLQQILKMFREDFC